MLHTFVRTLIIDAGQVLATLDKAVEVVGIDGNAMLLSRHAESFAKSLRNERVGISASWQIAFLNRKQEEVLEVQATCLEHSHHLHSSVWLAMERNLCARHHLSQQTSESPWQDNERIIFLFY